MIPLEKLIEYKGNRYELTKAMIELARNGKNLLQPEVKHKKDKYVAVVISNILDGKIKFGYTDENMHIDEYAPCLKSEEIYDETLYITKDDDASSIDDLKKDDDYQYDEDYDDDDIDDKDETDTDEKESDNDEKDESINLEDK